LNAVDSKNSLRRRAGKKKRKNQFVERVNQADWKRGLRCCDSAFEPPNQGNKKKKARKKDRGRGKSYVKLETGGKSG